MLPFPICAAPFSWRAAFGARAGAASAWPLASSVVPSKEGATATGTAAAAGGASACPLAGFSVLSEADTFLFHGFLVAGGGGAGL